MSVDTKTLKPDEYIICTFRGLSGINWHLVTQVVSPGSNSAPRHLTLRGYYGHSESGNIHVSTNFLVVEHGELRDIQVISSEQYQAITSVWPSSKY